jgi:hypothetical protein
VGSVKRLHSVCQSIAHHAVSGLSYLQPHISRACAEAGVDHLAIDLLSTELYSPAYGESRPLLLCLRSLRERFVAILDAEGFALDDLTEAGLRLIPVGGPGDDYSLACRATLTTSKGRRFERMVGFDGRTQAVQRGDAADPARRI